MNWVALSPPGRTTPGERSSGRSSTTSWMADGSRTARFRPYGSHRRRRTGPRAGHPGHAWHRRAGPLRRLAIAQAGGVMAPRAMNRRLPAATIDAETAKDRRCWRIGADSAPMRLISDRRTISGKAGLIQGEAFRRGECNAVGSRPPIVTASPPGPFISCRSISKSRG